MLLEELLVFQCDVVLWCVLWNVSELLVERGVDMVVQHDGVALHVSEGVQNVLHGFVSFQNDCWAYCAVESGAGWWGVWDEFLVVGFSPWTQSAFLIAAIPVAATGVVTLAKTFLVVFLAGSVAAIITWPVDKSNQSYTETCKMYRQTLADLKYISNKTKVTRWYCWTKCPFFNFGDFLKVLYFHEWFKVWEC